MKVSKIGEIIEKIAPVSLASEWDNVGLIIGDSNAEVCGVVVCVDLTDNVIDFCLSKNCNTIVTHHPAIFEPLKKVAQSDYTSALVVKCLKNDINVYSSHTNMDMSQNGINFKIAKELDVAGQPFLEDGLGFYGKYNGDLDKLLLDIKKITKEDAPKVYRRNQQKIAKEHKIAYISGSGGKMSEVIARLKQLDIDTFISSEFKHNILLEILSIGVNVVQIGHFESEVIFVDIVYDLLKNEASNLHKYTSLL